MPESPLRPQPVDRRPQEVVAQVERADDERGRAEEARSVGVEPPVRCRAAQARQNAGRVTQRICIGVDREHARVFGIRVSQPTGGVDQDLSRFGARIDPPSA